MDSSLLNRKVQIKRITPACLVGKIGIVIEEEGDELTLSIPGMEPWDKRYVTRNDVELVVESEISISESDTESEVTSVSHTCECGKGVDYFMSVDLTIVDSDIRVTQLPVITIARCRECMKLYFPNYNRDHDEFRLKSFASVNMIVQKFPPA